LSYFVQSTAKIFHVASTIFRLKKNFFLQNKVYFKLAYWRYHFPLHFPLHVLKFSIFFRCLF
jgi:hypothetical protein